MSIVCILVLSALIGSIVSAMGKCPLCGPQASASGGA